MTCGLYATLMSALFLPATLGVGASGELSLQWSVELTAPHFYGLPLHVKWVCVGRLWLCVGGCVGVCVHYVCGGCCWGR